MRSRFFFPSVASLGCGFLTTLSAQEVCCGKTGPCHCFHLSQRATELNLTPIRSQLLKILTSTSREARFNYSKLFIHCHVNVLMSEVEFTVWRSRLQRKQPKPISLLWVWKEQVEFEHLADNHSNETWFEKCLDSQLNESQRPVLTQMFEPE